MCRKLFKNVRRGLLKADRGTVMLEMTIMLPFLLVLAGGMFEFGNLLYKYQLVQSGVRDAARYLARVRDTSSTSPCGTGGCLTPCDAQLLTDRIDEAKNIAIYGSVDASTPKRVSWWNTTDVTASWDLTDNPLVGGYPTYRGPIGTGALKTIRVRTTANYPSAGFLSFLGLSNPIPFTIEHRERCIGEG